MTRWSIRRCVALFFVFTTTGLSRAQIVETSVCDVLANPQSFDGKIIRLRGTVAAGFDEFVVKNGNCSQSVNAIWLTYPEGTKGKAGPAAFVQLQLAKNNPASVQNPSRPSIKLDKNNKDFKQFDSLLSTPYKAGGMCLGCTRYLVKATLTGRLDGVGDAGLTRENGGKFVGVSGFGNLNLYRARLVLQAVSDISQQEVDYSKVSSATKDDSSRESSSGDPVAATHDAARAFGPDSAAGKQVERAAAAFGKEGEDNGVEVGFGTLNEVPRNDGSKGDNNSPDGLLLNCTFDTDRLKGDALSRAIAHVGEHVADLRDGSIKSSGLYELEYRAWQTVALNAVATKQKTLTMPGGYLLWNSAWLAADRSKMVDEGISSFLKEWVGMSK